MVSFWPPCADNGHDEFRGQATAGEGGVKSADLPVGRMQIIERLHISKFLSRCAYLVRCARGEYTFEV